jgi:hypothetical protein
MRRPIAGTLLIALLAAGPTGCIGRMAVRKNVLDFNLAVTQNRYARELVFLALYVVPVYPIAGAIDLVLVNSIEFWTGTNPVSGERRLARAGDTRVAEAADGSRSVATLRSDGSIDLDVIEPDGTSRRVNLAREADGIVARDAAGRPLGRVAADGAISLAEGAATQP